MNDVEWSVVIRAYLKSSVCKLFELDQIYDLEDLTGHEKNDETQDPITRIIDPI